MKNVGVKFPGGNKPVEQLTIEPGTTAQNVLAALNLNDSFKLMKNENEPFGMQEPIYGRVVDGEMLHVSSAMDAG